jgi:lysophospholipase L1-like esterase
MKKTNMIERRKRIVSILLTLLMFATVLFCVPNNMGVAYGTEEPAELSYDYIALGDSVIFGTTLKNPEKNGCFTLLTADLSTVTGENVSSKNLAVHGWDTGDILDMLADEETKEKLSDAKFITLNVGGNNLLGAVFDALTVKYHIPPGVTVQDYFSNHYFEALGLFRLSKKDFDENQVEMIIQGEKRFATEFPKIIHKIKQYAPDAKLAVSTIYNPFSSIFSIQDYADEIISHMNVVIKNESKVQDYTIADVYKSFKESDVSVVNTQLNPIDFFHPNIAGHRNIANEYLHALTGHINVDRVTIVGGGGNDEIAYEYISSNSKNTLVFSATVIAALGADKTIKWSLLPKTQDIAMVNHDTGLVTFTGNVGKITLTATSAQDPSKSDTKIINVKRAIDSNVDSNVNSDVNSNVNSNIDSNVNIPVIKKIQVITKIRTPLKSINITKGKRLTLPIELDEGKKTVTKSASKTFKSSNKKIVTVSKTGKIKGIKVGKAKIAVKAESGKTLVIKVNVVKKAVKLKKFTLSGTPKTKKLKVGATAQIKIHLAQKKATNLKVTYKSSKPKVISVDKAGKITALKKGKAVISVKVGAKTVKTKTISVS